MRSLVPSKAVQALVDGLDVSDCIGVHVRMEGGPGLDHQSYDSPDNWPAEGHTQIQYWREKSHYARFMRRVDELLEADPGRRIFLAADMPETYDAFLRRYGDRLLYLARDTFDRSARQLQFALADAILLSRTPILLGSTWSSFSELATRLAKLDQRVEFSGKDF
jgi:hypothetical protein